MNMYGKFTWKIENFSEISKRELRSNVFEVGGYKWCVPRTRRLAERCERTRRGRREREREIFRAIG